MINSPVVAVIKLGLHLVCIAVSLCIHDALSCSNVIMLSFWLPVNGYDQIVLVSCVVLLRA